MLVCFPTFQGDVDKLEKLLGWIEKLDPHLAHDCLLVFDRDTPFDAATRCHTIASRVFREVRTTATRKSVKGWPHGPNTLFFHAAKTVHEEDWPQPFLIMEPDAIPLRSGWLDALEAEYVRCGAKHMGCIENVTQATLPALIMSGVAIYGADVGKIPPIAIRPWNTDLANLLVPEAHHTNLIQDFFGQQNLPPYFVEQKQPDSPINALTLDFLKPEAVLFHRDKTHSLIPLLAKKLGVEWQPEPVIVPRRTEKIVVVFNVWQGDVEMAVKHAQWLVAMQGKSGHAAVMAHDAMCPRVPLTQLHAHLAKCFARVEICRYPAARMVYPQAANHAWQSVARFMAARNSPWLWMEADAVALVPDWLEQLQEEYDQCGKSWMGAVVEHMGHCNGTAIYPADAARRMPVAMSCRTGAFDMAAREDMGRDCHNAGHLMFHTWSILNGDWCPVGGGHIPINITPALADRIPTTAVMIHRIKDGSLINMLMAGHRKEKLCA